MRLHCADARLFEAVGARVDATCKGWIVSSRDNCLYVPVEAWSRRTEQVICALIILLGGNADIVSNTLTAICPAKANAYKQRLFEKFYERCARGEFRASVLDGVASLRCPWCSPPERQGRRSRANFFVA